MLRNIYFSDKYFLNQGIYFIPYIGIYQGIYMYFFAKKGVFKKSQLPFLHFSAVRQCSNFLVFLRLGFLNECPEIH